MLGIGKTNAGRLASAQMKSSCENPQGTEECAGRNLLARMATGKMSTRQIRRNSKQNGSITTHSVLRMNGVWQGTTIY